MSGRVLMFTVVGVAVPKGSTRAFVPQKWARAAVAQGRAPRAIVTSDNPKTKGWQQTIANCAALELLRAENVHCRFPEGPVVLEVAFFLPRPQALLTKANAARRIPHVKKPDLDKLLRSTKDALTGVVWTDDSQVVKVNAMKHYCAPGDYPAAIIRVRDVGPEEQIYGQSSLV